MSYRDNYDNINWKKYTFKPVKVTKRTKSHQVMGDILMELLSIQGLEEYNRGIQQRVQAETD